MRQYVVVFMMLAVCGCSGGGGSGGDQGGGNSSSAPDVDHGWPEIVVKHIYSGLNYPTSYASPNDGTIRMFATEQYSGKIMLDKNGKLQPTPFLDLSDKVKTTAYESGLLNITFSPNYKENGYFYVNYVGYNDRTNISRFKVSGNPDIADPDSEEVVMVLEERYAGNHYAGQMAFGPDGYLYIANGDGSLEFPVSDSRNVAQNKNSLLGKILRIDVEGQTTYAIPPDNPFVGQANARGEVWVYGLRNPWRFSFDRKTGDMYIADVGPQAWEAVYFQSGTSLGGENYGWSVLEGSHCYKPELGCEQEGITDPIIEYANEGGAVAAIGGYVYRGPGNCRMKGKYFFADFGTGQIWGAVKNGGVWETKLLENMNEKYGSDFYISSFGESEDGTLYLVIHWRGGENSGEIYYIHDPDGPQDCD
jgi:glucose/arabinose dehydrogenase